MERQNLSFPEEERAGDEGPLQGKAVKGCYEWMEAIIPALILIMVFFTFVIRSITVSGPSMEPTLMDQYKVWVSCIGYTPQAGDIVVVDGSGTALDEVIVKRIIATEGQTVDIDFDNGYVYVDGMMLDEDETLDKIADPGIAEAEITLGPDEFFVLGDNRNNSEDSRSGNIGPVKRSNIIGKAWFHLSGGEDGWGFVK